MWQVSQGAKSVARYDTSEETALYRRLGKPVKRRFPVLTDSNKVDLPYPKYQLIGRL